jgi:hypothetical protein
MPAKASGKTVVVTGDVTMDWNIARRRGSRDASQQWSPQDWTRASWQRGGAALLADLVEAIAAGLRREGTADFTVRQAGAPYEPVSPSDDRFHHSYALWSEFKSPDGVAWRVEEYLGLDRAAAQVSPEASQWQQVVDDPARADLVVLDDAALGFRDSPDLWPQVISAKGQRPWVLIKMARPVARGRLWEHLLERCSDRLVVVTTVGDLRRTEVQISQGLSWERTAQDVAWELVYNPRVNSLTRCACTIVSFGPAGALLLSRLGAERKAGQVRTSPQGQLSFDAQVIEGEWEQGHPGGMIGYTTCLAAGVARQLMLSPDQPDVGQGVQSGLAAMRALHLAGYGEQGTHADAGVVFPIERTAAQVAGGEAGFAVVDVQDPVRFLAHPGADQEEVGEHGLWTILEDRYPQDLDQVARQIVLSGVEAVLQGVPLGRFGHLLTVDRREIESYRAVRALICEYLGQREQDQPLSIAVFGPPGSGKSFGIKQTARSLAREEIQPLEFNLSQFESEKALVDALHQVRDVSLGGKTPLVFWDEFDTPLQGERLGWLRYFLAPMQDGAFREGQITHPIGRAIFVFAGGTSERMEDFGRGLDEEGLRAAKVPDFVSRLKGYVNVLGPNAHEDGPDRHCIIRRAILLRSILLRSAPQLFGKAGGGLTLRIDPGVLRAFLKIGEYKHGVRSIVAIVGMSLLGGKTAYERSSLPSEAQLDLHVDGQEFLALVQEIELEPDLLEQLAEAAHEVFCDGLRAQGYKLGARTDEKRKLHSSLKPYAELPEEEKEQNRGTVRDIPNKLARAGYVMRPARSDEPPFEFPGPHLDRLAMMEHERWMQAQLDAGWRHGRKTDKEAKVHSGLVPWDELPKREKDKDRLMVREIPRILAKAGYAVARLGSGSREK